MSHTPRAHVGAVEARVERTRGGRADVVRDTLAIEAPLEIRVDGEPLATLMRTPGDDEVLALGFLLSEGLVDGLDDVRGLAHCTEPAQREPGNVLHVRLAEGVDRAAISEAAGRRRLLAGSACGVCGRATIDDLLARLRPLSPRPWPAAESVQARARALRATQSLFELTGGVHGAALFDRQGALLAAHEDVGRHNAVDKVLGARLRRGTPLSEHDDETLVVSSRAGFEIVQKAVAGRVPVVLTVGAATSLADALARAANVRLFSFVRDAGFNRHGDG